DQARRHGRHVEHQIVRAVGGDGGDRLATLQPALAQAAGQGGDARPRLAPGDPQLLVGVGGELDDEVAVVGRAGVEDGGEVADGHDAPRRVLNYAAPRRVVNY